MKEIIEANVQLLKEAATIIAPLDGAVYRQQMQLLSSGSIGQHMRHIIDHYLAILNKQDDVIDYDHRRRDCAVEANIQLTLKELEKIMARIQPLKDQPVFILSEASPQETIVTKARSTIKRELLFAGSHAVHHFAIIGIFLRLLGADIPEAFGVAPATLSYQRAVDTAGTENVA